MTEFDNLVDKIVSQNTEYPVLRTIIEKELLHQDILRTMRDMGALKNLTFIGGTCLRNCYGSPRLSEDLDFTGGFDFSKNDIKDLGDTISQAIFKKYSLSVLVTDPIKEIGNTDTWKIKIITHPKRSDLPAQKINIDICHLQSYEKKVSMINNNYEIDMGTDGILLYVESLEEILCDKLIAFAHRPNRVKHRDLWDLHWISQKKTKFKKDLLLQKLSDRKISEQKFKAHYKERLESLQTLQKDFLFEMRRFLLPSAFSEQFTSDMWWQYLIHLIEQYD